MSRGLGRVQRMILSALEAHRASAPLWPGLRPDELARRLYGPQPTGAQRAGIRQAVTSLQRRRLVVVRHAWRRRRVDLPPAP